MFPLPLNTEYELAFGTPSTSYLTHNHTHEDLITNYEPLENNNNLINFSIGSSNDGEVSKSRARKKESRDECGSSSSKKAMHRQVEKKRRQEMSNLYASLRSLLPDHQIKGKLSVCDQMGEAAIHIKRMEKNIGELKIRRDKLKSNVINNTSSRENSETLDGGNNVMVNMVSNGIEILISHSIKRSDLGLSRVLAELQRSDLDVINSVSTRMRENFVHKIQVEVRDMKDLDVFVLKDRLSKVIK